MPGSAFGRDPWGNPKWGGLSPATTTYIWGTVEVSLRPEAPVDWDYGVGLGGGRRSAPSEVVTIEVPYDTLAPSAPSISVTPKPEALLLNLTPPSTNADGTPCLDFKEFEVFYSSHSGIDVTDPTTYDGSFKTSSYQYTFPTEETTYFVAVAWDHDGNHSAASSEVSGTPEKPTGTVDDYPSNIKQVIVGAGMIGIEFQPPKASWFRWAGYKLYYQFDSGSGWNGTWQLIYQGPGPGFLHKGLDETYKYKYLCTVTTEDGSETEGTISDNNGNGYQPNASDNSDLLSETIFAERIIATKEIISRTLIGGTLHSLNWTNSAGTEISLDDEVFRMGGSSVGYLSGVGLWLGKAGTVYKLFVGDSSGDHIAFDGVRFTIEGALIAKSGSSIDGDYLIDLSVGTAKLADLSVTTAKIADAAITTAKIQDAAITNAKIDDAAITTAKIADLAVTSEKVSELTFEKITAGTNTASLTIGSSGYIKSANYSAGSAGFIIRGSGNAEFNDVTVRGEIHTGSGSELNADYITTGTITGRTFQTAASGTRAILGPTTTKGHALEIYDSDSVTAWVAIREVAVGENGYYKLKLDAVSNALIGDSSDPPRILHFSLHDSVTGCVRFSGTEYFTGNMPTSWSTWDLSDIVGSRRAFVFLRFHNSSNNNTRVAVRPAGSGWDTDSTIDIARGCSLGNADAEMDLLLSTITDSAGRIEVKAGASYYFRAYVEAYVV